MRPKDTLVLRCLAVVLVALQASVPAFSQKAGHLVLNLQWEAQAQFSGYYAALEKGFFEEEGLDVEFSHLFTTESVDDKVRNNKDEIFTLPLDQALVLIDSGVPLVNILQTSMNNALALVSYNGADPLTLNRPRVAVWSSGFSSLLNAWAIKEKVDYRWTPAATTCNLLVAGAVNASAVMVYNEYYQLMQLGFEVSENAIYRLSEHGYNIQEDGLYMTRRAYLRNKDAVDRFVRACRRGWEWVSQNEEEALDIVMKQVRVHRNRTNRILQKLMQKEILRLQLDPDSGEREFRLRPDMVEQASKLLFESGVTGREVPYSELMP